MDLFFHSLLHYLELVKSLSISMIIDLIDADRKNVIFPSKFCNTKYKP